MNINEELQKEHSKRLTNSIVAYVGEDADRFSELMDVFFHKDPGTSQRAAWAMSYVVESHPKLFLPYAEKALAYMQKDAQPDAIIRNTLRAFAKIHIPSDLQAPLVDSCLLYLQAPKTAVAIKAFSLYVLERLCEEHPELAKEVCFLIHERIMFEKPAFVSRGKHFLRKFGKIV